MQGPADRLGRHRERGRGAGKARCLEERGQRRNPWAPDLVTVGPRVEGRSLSLGNVSWDRGGRFWVYVRLEVLVCPRS